MTLLIIVAALLVIATIVVSLFTAADLQKQRRQVATLEQAALELEQELEQLEGQKQTIQGSLALHTRLRQEKQDRIAELNEELEFLKEDRVAEHKITVAGAKKKDFSLEDEDEPGEDVPGDPPEEVQEDPTG